MFKCLKELHFVIWYSCCFNEPLTEKNHPFFYRIKIMTFDTCSLMSLWSAISMKASKNLITMNVGSQYKASPLKSIS